MKIFLVMTEIYCDIADLKNILFTKRLAKVLQQIQVL